VTVEAAVRFSQPKLELERRPAHLLLEQEPVRESAH